MSDVQITFDVVCVNNQGLDRPSYRLYFDNDLITERTFIWDEKTEAVEENLFLNLEPGIHSARAELVGDKKNVFVFFIKNVKVNERPVVSTQGVVLRESYFTVDC